MLVISDLFAPDFSSMSTLVKDECFQVFYLHVHGYEAAEVADDTASLSRASSNSSLSTVTNDDSSRTLDNSCGSNGGGGGSSSCVIVDVYGAKQPQLGLTEDLPLVIQHKLDDQVCFFYCLLFINQSCIFLETVFVILSFISDNIPVYKHNY